MSSKARWLYEMLRHRLGYPGRYCHRECLSVNEASVRLKELILSRKPFNAGRMGFFELAVMRNDEFGMRGKLESSMHSLYCCAGFFPEDTALAGRFSEEMKSAYGRCDLYACNREPAESYFIDRYTAKNIVAAEHMGLYDVFKLEEPWTSALKGKRVLVVTSFPDSVREQYGKRELIYPGTEILPEFKELQVYEPLNTIGDMRDERFTDWFEGLEHMKKEIREKEFDIALIAAGAYGFPLAADIKKSGRQAVCMGGVMQILFGIMGRRWDGSRFGGPEHMHEKLKRYYNDSWIYPLEERPAAADGVEYGPYWK
ncbi:MAG: hypothetical protein IKI75_06920 [Lachnospiraceae bacterium]|nr:hypothetical protein [Lachnospiraceae bacterium]